jgi:hypothetical protein
MIDSCDTSFDTSFDPGDSGDPTLEDTSLGTVLPGDAF